MDAHPLSMAGCALNTARGSSAAFGASGSLPSVMILGRPMAGHVSKLGSTRERKVHQSSRIFALLALLPFFDFAAYEPREIRFRAAAHVEPASSGRDLLRLQDADDLGV
jgi:hypothetical protein